MPDNSLGRVSLKDVNYSLDSLEILRNIDLSVNSREIVSIIGPSGCGKSSVLNLISGLERPDSGQIKIEGKSDQFDRLNMISYMQQKDLLLPWRTVLDNVILGLEIQGIPKKESRKIAMEQMEKFGLLGFENKYPFTLSGGMKQRAAFLRTILMNRPILLLDEPFSALDALNRMQMQEWVIKLFDGLDKTVIFVTHDIDEAIFLSDRIYVMSSSPGEFISIENIKLSRPRSREIMFSSDVLSIKNRLLNQLLQPAL
ncbi:MAG: ABC transporter [Dehalococcoidia bacterium]|nr:ABC transporter [Dehalococcoidia bacterium]